MIEYQAGDIIKAWVCDEHGKAYVATATVLETIGSELLVVRAQGLRYKHLIDRSKIVK